MKFQIIFSIIVHVISYSDCMSQDWGFVKVRPKAYLFWWLYYSPESINVTKDSFTKPLVIWLQGGPGESSTGVGNFLLIGPQDINQQTRTNSWVNDYNVLFIDSPVGAGFSYTESEFAFSTTNTEIANDLVTCIKEFYNTRTEFMHIPTYIAGESYAGKIAIEFANIWYKEQSGGSINSNLKGILLGNPWISPRTIISSYGSFLKNTGFIDENGRNVVENYVNNIHNHMKGNRWLEATNTWISMRKLILNLTNNINFNNVLTEMPSYDYMYYNDENGCIQENKLNDYMNGHVKRKLDINCTIWGSQKGQVQFYLYEDIMKSAFDEVENTLKDTQLKVYIYVGQLAATVDTSGTLDWIYQLKWNYINEWKSSTRETLIIDGIIEGYMKKYDRLALYWISRSGDKVPKDNPAAALRVIQDLTND